MLRQRILTDNGQRLSSFDYCNFTSTGSNTYFILQLGYQTMVEGVDEGVDTRLTTTVLNETKAVDAIDIQIGIGQIKDDILDLVSYGYVK
jgi:hypothetical protein